MQNYHENSIDPERINAEWQWVREMEHAIHARDRQRLVALALLTLRPRERHVLALRFGLAAGLEGCGMTLASIGKDIGTTAENVRKIEAQALRRMRHPVRARMLHPARDPA